MKLPKSPSGTVTRVLRMTVVALIVRLAVSAAMVSEFLDGVSQPLALRLGDGANRRFDLPGPRFLFAILRSQRPHGHAHAGLSVSARGMHEALREL